MKQSVIDTIIFSEDARLWYSDWLTNNQFC